MERQSKDNERLLSENGMRKIVFDCFDPSPYYEATGSDPQTSTTHLSVNIREWLKYESTDEKIQTSVLYAPICHGRGAPWKLVPGTARYTDRIRPYYKLTSKKDKTLIFESRFENANLRRAVQVYYIIYIIYRGNYEYDLFLKPDFSTGGFTQWFYFKVGNTREEKNYTFNIVNMMKPDSLHNDGMRILMYSKQKAQNRKVGWHRVGEDIFYYSNVIKKKNGSSPYYTLTFTLTFPHENDEVYICHSYPYTYTDLSMFMNKICMPENRDRIRRTTMCKSLAGNNCEMLIITNFRSTPEEIAERGAVVLTARVHPGETGSSFIVEGLVEYLINRSWEGTRLRDHYVFKIIPMLNPDGVIVGNYRCSLSGQDLNRQWIDPRKRLHPIVHATKMVIIIIYILLDAQENTRK